MSTVLRFFAPWLLSLCSAVPLSLAGQTNTASGVHNLRGEAIDPLGSILQIKVLLFVRTDCPITNRYAPELKHLAEEYANQNVALWLVYSDNSETVTRIREQVAQFGFPGVVLVDPQHQLVRRAHATVAPEAAVFDKAGALRYHGRIDDRWVAVGKTRPSATTYDLRDAIAATLAGKPVLHPETRAIGCSLADIE